MAFGSSRPPGSWFRPQPTRVKAVVLGPHVPKGSRTKPTGVPAVTPMPHAGPGSPLTGSLTPQPTGRVVAGSKIVPTGMDLPNASAPRVLLACPVIRSAKLVYGPFGPFLSASVGTDPVRIVP